MKSRERYFDGGSLERLRRGEGLKAHLEVLCGVLLWYCNGDVLRPHISSTDIAVTCACRGPGLIVESRRGLGVGRIRGEH